MCFPTKYLKYEEVNILDVIFSATVIAAFVTGISALIVSVINNRKLQTIEKERQHFVFEQDRYNKLTEKLGILTAQSDVLDFAPIILPHNQFDDIHKKNADFLKLYQASQERFIWLKKHYKKTQYLLDIKYRSAIETRFSVIDNITYKINKALVFDEDGYHIDTSVKNEVGYWLKDRIRLIIECNKEYINILSEQINDIKNQTRVK